MKALIVTWEAKPEAATATPIETLFASLDALGIDHGRAMSGGMPSNSVINSEYDFIVFPQMNGNPPLSTIVKNINITIPMFALAVGGAHNNLGGFPGVTGLPKAKADQFLDVLWTDSVYTAANCNGYELTDGKAIATISATEPASLGGAAQTHAGTVAMWRGSTTGGNYIYYNTFNPAIIPSLIYMIQEAINDGVLSAADIPRRAPLSVDLDHINGVVASTEPEIIDKIASFVPPGGVIWCGIWDNDTDDFENMGDEVRTRLDKYSWPKGPLKYCYHNHKYDVSSGSFPNVVELLNKVDQAAAYEEARVVWEDTHGLEFHLPAYYNIGTNEFTESTMELLTPDTSITADDTNTATQAGIGFRIFRNWRLSTRAGPANGSRRVNQHKNRHTAHGMLIVNTADMSLDSGGTGFPFDTAAKWASLFGWQSMAIAMGGTLYLHDDDFKASEQDPGVDRHGWEAYGQLTSMSTYYKDVIKGYADPIDYYPDSSMSLAGGRS